MPDMQNSNLTLQARGVLVKMIGHMNELSKEVYKGTWYASDVIIQDWEMYHPADCSPDCVPAAFTFKMVNPDGDYKDGIIYYYIKNDGSRGCRAAKGCDNLFKDKNKMAILKLGWQIIFDLTHLQEYSPMNFYLRFPTVTKKLTMEHLKGFKPVDGDIVLIDFGGTDDFLNEVDKAVDDRIAANRRALGILTE